MSMVWIVLVSYVAVSLLCTLVIFASCVIAKRTASCGQNERSNTTMTNSSQSKQPLHLAKMSISVN